MLKILACEDDALVLEEIQKRIEKVKSYQIDLCLIDDAVDEKILDKNYDVVLMDIRLKELDGIQMAVQMRNYQPHLKFIFISNYIDEYLEGLFLEIDPYGILKKPINYEYLFELLEKLHQEKMAQKGIVLKMYGGQVSRFDPKDIRYIESNKRVIEIHYKNQIERCYNSLDNIQMRLPDYFIRCHKSYLVNMKEIENFGHKNIRLYSGEIIDVSRSKRKETLESYMKFIREEL